MGEQPGHAPITEKLFGASGDRLRLPAIIAVVAQHRSLLHGAIGVVNPAKLERNAREALQDLAGATPQVPTAYLGGTTWSCTEVRGWLALGGFVGHESSGPGAVFHLEHDVRLFRSPPLNGSPPVLTHLALTHTAAAPTHVEAAGFS